MAVEVNRISEMFRGKTVFISGATGFLGKILIEKLLRVTEVKTLYLLVRQKKMKSPKDRVQEMFNHVLFSRLKKERPSSTSKCVAIAGDVTQLNLGLSQNDREIIQNEVDFIFHSAATTRFDDTVRTSVKMNTLGTKYMLDLAKGCKKLQLFVHVSTAYAFPNESVLYEKLYDPPADPHAVLDSLEKNEQVSEEFYKNLMGDCPNTYTFSKALAEGLASEQMNSLPIIIVRPAVVIPTWKEPIPGFFNNLQSPMGIFVGAGKGVIRSVYMDSKSYANLIPADSTINVMLVAAWDYLTTKKQRVFNLCVPQEDLSINWEDIIEMGKEVIHTKVPFNQIVWYPGGVMTKNQIWHYFNVVLFQLIPAAFIDLLLVCLGYKPVLIGVNQRLLKGQDMFQYYTMKVWDFNTEYFLNMRRKLNEVEKKIFKVEAENVNIKEYLADCILYARRHIFHETDDRLPAAKRNLKLFFVLDRIVKIGFFFMLINYVYRLFF
ncbi:fatty acyl-CoA reductase 1-like [Anthonomus grandis grandis]|uniref:fatty acyl-CoA reductase 1-like n=1 Tax=Anthonomus grandis grandis TaxID=2921223 RepID=UPI002166B2F8|nr:fatty acyl-CoA reductase 1-like [Anthonomus grandis grandis]XP_050316025.1 fatty acyl-CoA reductase 1-like [Anthonomus grandis grandis]